jgi:hypothetical protein
LVSGITCFAEELCIGPKLQHLFNASAPPFLL